MGDIKDSDGQGPDPKETKDTGDKPNGREKGAGTKRKGRKKSPKGSPKKVGSPGTERLPEGPIKKGRGAAKEREVIHRSGNGLIKVDMKDGEPPKLYKLANRKDPEEMKALGLPDSLEECDQKAIAAIMGKYPPNVLIPLLKSLISAGVPVEGVAENFTPDMWAHQLMQWAFNDEKARLIDRTKAWSEAAKFLGQYPTDSPKGQQLNVQFNMKYPQNIADIDAKIKETGTDDA